MMGPAMSDALYKVNQIVGYGWALGAILLGVVFVCYFIRNWPPEFSKIRFQLVLALAIIFITQGVREFLSAHGWDRDPSIMAAHIQELRLLYGVFKATMGLAGLLAIRALSYEIYGNRLALALAAAVMVGSVAAYFYIT